jgi:hypothetical protein
MKMIVRKMVFVSAVSLCLLTCQAVASEQAQSGASGNTAAETETDSGVVNSIDLAMNQVVISDRIYNYSPGRLIVRRGGRRTSGATSLQPNQVVHFVSAPRKPGSSLATGGTITEIWIDEK